MRRYRLTMLVADTNNDDPLNKPSASTQCDVLTPETWSQTVAALVNMNETHAIIQEAANPWIGVVLEEQGKKPVWVINQSWDREAFDKLEPRGTTSDRVAFQRQLTELVEKYRKLN